MYSSVILLVLLMCSFEFGQQKILRGQKANQREHTHMAALSNGRRHRKVFCGGAVISSRAVLTAAHCIEFAYFDGCLDESLRVIVGSTNWKNGTMYSISHNVTHPEYKPDTMKNDIGLLVTVLEVDRTGGVTPVKLDYNPVDGKVSVKVAGWGMTESGQFSDVLMEMYLETINNDDCQEKNSRSINETGVNYYSVDPLIEICTYHSKGHGTCMVDSGGPLTRIDNGKIIGIVSWGHPCAIGVPDVFVRVSAFKDWLKEVIVQ